MKMKVVFNSVTRDHFSALDTAQREYQLQIKEVISN